VLKVRELIEMLSKDIDAQRRSQTTRMLCRPKVYVTDQLPYIQFP
jgi:hypothetical protein